MEIFKPLFLPKKQWRKGFTLTEIAIVLGIIGLILGAVWTAASGAYASTSATNFSQLVMRYIVSVRSACNSGCSAPPTVAYPPPDIHGAGDANGVAMSGVIPNYIVLQYTTPAIMNSSTNSLFNGLVSAATATGSFFGPSGDIVGGSLPSCANYSATNTAPSCSPVTHYSAIYSPGGGTNLCTSAGTVLSGSCNLVTNIPVTPGKTYTFGFSQSF